MAISTNRVTFAIAERLRPLLPAGISISATGGLVQVSRLPTSTEQIDVGSILKIAPDEINQVVRTIVLVMSHVQDFIALELGIPWPGKRRLPLPVGHCDAAQIHLAFKDELEGEISLEPIAYAQLVNAPRDND